MLSFLFWYYMNTWPYLFDLPPICVRKRFSMIFAVSHVPVIVLVNAMEMSNYGGCNFLY